MVQRLALWIVHPRRLVRLDFLGDVPEDARTMVIIPTLLTSVKRAEALIEHVEVLALANLDPNIHFAILSDFEDSAARDRPDDAAILAAARDGLAALIRRFGAGHEHRFFLFHRDRLWNPSEQVWMGWERKRGKIEEFNALLRGATDTGYVVQVGALDVLPSVRYCLTLDRDTFLPRDAAKKLIGIIAHPLNRPSVDRVVGRVVQGYGILQPRVSVTMASALGSIFARTYAGHTGVDPYTTAVSDVYQDLFDEGIFTGKAVKSTPSAVSTGACPTTRSCRTISSRAYARTRCLRRGSRRRLSVERARARAPAAPLGSATGRSCSGCSPSSTLVKASSATVCRRSALEDPRQPASQPDWTGDRRALRRRLDRVAGAPWCGRSPRAAVGFPLYQRLAEVLADRRKLNAGRCSGGQPRECPHRGDPVRAASEIFANQAARWSRDWRDAHPPGDHRRRCSNGRPPRASRAERSSRSFFSQMVASPPSRWRAGARPAQTAIRRAVLLRGAVDDGADDRVLLSRPTVRRPPSLNDVDRRTSRTSRGRRGGISTSS
jgi:hypothetical protein